MADNLFVNRNNTTYQVDMENLRTIEDTDLLLVNRNGTTYTVTGDKISTGGSITQVNLAPLSGTPEFEVTATTDLPSILDESTINYRWYRYSASTGGTGTLLQELTSDSAILDTYTTIAADQGSYIGCTVTYLGTTVTETARTQCLTAPGPIATMHGLRFDSSRSTFLSRENHNTGNYFTCSFWIKPTTSSNEWVWQSKPTAGSSSNQYGLFKNTNFEWEFVNESTINSVSTYELNVWTHIVIVSRSSFDVDVYVDGDLKGTYNRSFIANENVFAIGGAREASQYNGYLSDFYLVSDQSLPPTTFGKTFEPYGWGPLDSSQIKENIGDTVVQPYDTRANTDQVWSASVTATDGYITDKDPSSGFDGTQSTVCVLDDNNGNNEGVITIAISPPLSGKVEIGINPNRKVGVNGGNQITTSGTSSSSGPLFEVGEYEEVNSIEIQSIPGGYPASFSAIKVGGRLLVDNGVWDNSQNWSINGTSTGGYSSVDRTWAKAFDGIAEVGANSVNPSSGETASCTFPTSPTFTTLRLFCGYGGVAIPDGFKVNNQDITSQVGDQGWYTITGVSSPLTSIQLTRTSGFDPLLHAIELDGTILVDAGAQWNTSQFWSGNTLGTPFNETYSIEKAYDGSFETRALAAADTDLVLTASPSITVNTSLRINLKIDNFSGVDVLKVNGTDYSNLIDKTGRYWVTIPESVIQTLTFGRTTGAGIEQCSVAAIEVDGKLLVDSGSFGDNGFYLPFDSESPASENYPELWDNDVENPDTCFVASTNEDLSNICWARQWYGTGYETGDYVDGQKQDYVWTLETPIVGNVEIIFRCESGGYGTLAKLNDREKYLTQTSSGNTLIFTDTKLESITLQSFAKESGNALQRTGIASLKVNGKTLTVFSSIGFDDSGNKNNFSDQNLYAPPSQSVNGFTNTINKSYFYPGQSGYAPPENIFDNDLTNYASTRTSDGDNFYTFDWTNAGLGTCYSLRVKLFANNGNGQDTIRFKINDNQKIISSSPRVDGWVDVSVVHDFPVNIDTFQVNLYQGNSTTQGIYAIEYNGVILKDNIYIDTVTDTPLRNYSVLEIGPAAGAGLYNGNLQAQGSNTNVYSSVVSNLKISSGKYYAEFTTLQIPDYNAPYFGVAGANFNATGGVENWDIIGATLANVGVSSSGVLIGLAFDADIKSLDIYVDGVKTPSSIISDYLGAGPYEFFYTPYGSGQTSPDVAFNFGQQPFVASNVTDDQATGTVELPADIQPYDQRANTDQVWSSTITSAPGGFDPSYPTTNSFDGRLDTTAFTNGGSTYEVDLSSFTATSLQIQFRSDTNTGFQYSVSGTNIEDTNYGGNNTIEFVDIPLTGTDASFVVSSTSQVAITAIKVNDRLLVDNGVWDNSQNWSGKVVGTGMQSGQTPPDFFDGDITNTGVHAATNQTCVLDFTEFPSGSYELYFRRSANTITGDDLVTVNGSAFLAPNEQWLTVPGSELNEITLQNPSRNVLLTAIKLDGEILVDGGDPWNTSQVWSSSVINPSPTNDNSPVAVFAGDNPLTQTKGITALTSASSVFPTVTLPITLNNSTVRVYFDLNASQSDFEYLVAGGKSTTTSVGINNRYYAELTGCTGDDIVMTFKYLSGGGSTCYIYQYVVDGEILVNPSGGTYNTLFQTWEESKVVVFRAQIAAANLLMAALTEHAQTYDASENYCEGSVIKAFGELWIAVCEAPPTTFADLPSLVSHSNWERLGISV